MDTASLTAFGTALLSAYALMQEQLTDDEAHLLWALPGAAARGHLFVDIDPASGECLACAIMGPAEWRDVSLTDGALGPARLGRGEALACVWFGARDRGLARARRFIARAAADWPGTTHLVWARRGRADGSHIRRLRRPEAALQEAI